MGVPVVGTIGKKIFGTRNDRLVKRYMRIVDLVSTKEADTRCLTDQQLKVKTVEFRKRIEEGETAEDLIPEVFAIAREAMDRSVGIRNIFNPIHEFDSSQLPADARKLFDETKALIDSTEDRKPDAELLGSVQPVPAWQFVDIPVALYDAVRELYPKSKPPFRARPFDVQLIGAVVLYEGQIAEMKTGEGKTIVAPLACYLSAIENKQVHVVTVNDYLVQRDRDWTFPFFRMLGMTVGAIHPQHMQHPQLKQMAYYCDVVYGTTAEFGFDYLRDNMKMSVQEQVQKRRQIAIVDEVDSTLIDEARTPLIISGQAHEGQPRYEMADRLARFLLGKQEPWTKADQAVQSCLVQISGLEGDIRNSVDKVATKKMQAKLAAEKSKLPELEKERDRYTQFYEIELDKKKATLTHEGVSEAQREANIGSFYVGENMDVPHLLEQSIRGHTVYQRDRDYMVAEDDKGVESVIIIDQNTGRKMVGRQWSDGLHQAIEAKEGVPIKEETQTMATITIQNFYKLYEKLAGMTGTADTEATEFYEIYSLDVIVIPTNVPVIRDDHNDLVFTSQKDKLVASIKEIYSMYQVGRPVLVGTTSVEKSKELSQELKSKHNVSHEVLNAEQHERESEIVKFAGNLGAVTVATNMAGRGTDIKLDQLTPDVLIEHWKRTDICPSDVTANMSEEDVVKRIYRHIASKELGLRKSDVSEMSDEDIYRQLLEYWWSTCCWWVDGDKASSMKIDKMLNDLDHSGACLLHRIRFYENIEDLGGLHVIATERHESRRIDNQLRGRSGRQGDNGSSRFFLSLEDDLMQMFAGPRTLQLLSKMGMKEGVAIEHNMLTKAITKAQRKVEERNFLVRKNILEYDEVMDHQRHIFYDLRQRVLEGVEIRELIFEYIEKAVADSVYNYLDPIYSASCITEWIRENLIVGIEPERILGKDREDLHKLIIRDSLEESVEIIRVTIGEYLPDTIDLGDGKVSERDETTWDYKGAVDWAVSAWDAKLSISDATNLSREEIISSIQEAASAKILSLNLAPLDQYLVPKHAQTELANWVTSKFEISCEASDFDNTEPEEAVELVMNRAMDTYKTRERVYPIESMIEMTGIMMQQDPAKAIEGFCNRVKVKYDLDWTPNSLPSNNPEDLKKFLLEEAERWDDERYERRAQRMLDESGGDIDAWLREHWSFALSEKEKERAEVDALGVATDKIKQAQRAELAHLERTVLLQIFDGAWKDHLHQMDQARESIGFRSFSQLDPRIEYKREGARLFDEMFEHVQDRVTDLVFKARMQVSAPQQPANQKQKQQPKQQPQPKQMPAKPKPAEQSVRAASEVSKKGGSTSTMSVGRNEPCPCGSGNKYKKCCGKK
ncbi:MAG: preprotein translocase subunit SecA [Phycisphaerales bacterium]|nr:preprotein translocase subunit SecA [Planctomycetota bacterium]MBL6997266.1 preprotein translocase subunit SecA [Phycisphaerales bacterium]